MTAIYRKYRPTTFSDVIGQPHIVKTLTNQITLGKIGHAYLFSGSRGTGKTTCAKIFARAVNCTKPIDGSPCHKCDVCKSLSSPSNIDIIEIDAASNNGVDEMRVLREEVGYLPVGCRYKVYIIDEVHMLTGEAFNALLKTLEEPPAHVIFVLATTEPNRLPATILSRCMRFDFRLVSTEVIADRIKSILGSIKIKFDDDAVLYIAKAGEGSVRDALSLLDLCVSHGDKLTYQGVIDMLGVGGFERVSAIFDSVVSGDTPAILKLVDEACAVGISPKQLGVELLSYAREVLLSLTLDSAAADYLNITKSHEAAIAKSKAGINISMVVSIMDELARLESERRHSLNYRLQLEVVLLKLSSTLSQNITIGTITTPKQPISKPVSALGGAAAQKVWGKLVAQLRKAASMSVYNAITHCNGFEFVDNKLIIDAATADIDILDTSDVKELVAATLKEQGLIAKVEIISKKSSDNMDDTVRKIKQSVGNANVKVQDE